jgi:hypothetical protein
MAAANNTDLTLTTSRYTQPGVYVGEIINPGSSNLSADARIPAVIAKGSRLAVANNAPIIRAFIQGAQLNFSKTPPYVAPLVYKATGAQALPNRLYQSDGTQLDQSQWKYVIDQSGNYSSVQISNQSFNTLATYLMDYQSADPSVQDPIPLAEIRQITSMGTSPSTSQFQEYRDYFVPISFTSVMPDEDNVHTSGFLSAITASLQAGSTGSAVVDASAAYTHAYNRNYKITCLSVSGSPGTRQAVFKWQSSQASGGNEALPSNPLNPTDSYPTFLIDETNPATFAQILELGVILDFSFGSSNFVAGDIFTLLANGPSLVEVDSRYASPQFATVAAPVPVENSGNTNDFVLNTDPTSAYQNAFNNNYRLKLISMSGTSPNRQFNFVWCRYGDLLAATGTFSMFENNYSTYIQPLTDGVSVNCIIGTTSPDVGTQWDIEAQAPRMYYTAKDSRQYTFNMQAPTQVGTVATVTGGFSTNTTEGNFGTFSASFDTAGSLVNAGFALLPDNVSVAFRNIPSFANLDIFTFGVVASDVLDWSLEQKVQDVRQITEFQTDTNGSISGAAGSPYVVLSQVPTEANSISVINYNTGAEISFNWSVGTQFVYFNANPNVPIQINYLSMSDQPAIGQAYYLSCQFLRPMAYYNTPFLVLGLQAGQNYARPSTLDNDLYVGNQIGWANNTIGLYLVQPYNQDGSGNYSTPDYVNAITSIRNYPRITDLCLLNFPAGLSQVLEENILGNDPFTKRPNLVWYGASIGTPVGDENTAGSLVQLATQTLQAPGASSAKGTRILVAPTTATVAITLESGQAATVTVDGSFVALAGAALVSSFADPATDILEQQVNGFATIQIYDNSDISLLGQAQILYVNGSNGVYTWGEDTTVDATTNFSQINTMTQRAFVTSNVTRNMKSLIGIVPASSAAAQTLIRGQLASILRGLLARGLLGQYQDANGNTRPFDPQADIVIYQDQEDPTLFYFNYAWYSRNVIKRLFGLYALNNNDFSDGVVGT